MAVFFGDAFDNLIVGTSSDDAIYAGAGNDMLDGGYGFDLIEGGPGIDTVTYDFYPLGITANLETGSVGFPNSGSPFTDSLFGAENLIGSRGNDTMIGNALNNDLQGGDGNDVLSGGDGDDSLSGGKGDDVLDGGFGFDRMDGGEGIDTVIYDFYLGGINADLQTGVVSFPGSGSTRTDSLLNVENVIGSRGNDTIAGNAFNNTLQGGEGNDTLDGQGGTDTLIGGLGDDTYIINDTSDTIVEAANGGIDTVNAAISYTLGDNLENLTLTGTSSINGTGNALNNVLRGNSGGNTLNGKEGNDILIGGLGNDIYIVNDPGDRIVENLNEGLDVVAASISYALEANLEHLGLTGTENINGTGNELDNVIVGNAGVNTLDGGAGNDSLIGGAGQDVLKGGAGADKFVFNSTNDRVDRIQDFSRQEGDKVILIANGFNSLSSGQIRGNQFALGNKAKDNNDRLIYNKKNGALFYDADGNGSGAKVRITTFETKPTLGASDFLVVASPF